MGACGETGYQLRSASHMNARSARLFARAILEAADRAEELEVEMGWHPAQAVR